MRLINTRCFLGSVSEVFLIKNDVKMTEAEQISESDVGRDYESSLLELKANSKPHINMLTMLADENQRFASKIAQIIESRIEKVSILFSSWFDLLLRRRSIKKIKYFNQIRIFSKHIFAFYIPFVFAYKLLENETEKHGQKNPNNSYQKGENTAERFS